MLHRKKSKEKTKTQKNKKARTENNEVAEEAIFSVARRCEGLEG